MGCPESLARSLAPTRLKTTMHDFSSAIMRVRQFIVLHKKHWKQGV
jgi:hypothetical protein